MKYQPERASSYWNQFSKILCQMADKMLNTKKTNNITLDFIQCMIPHHEAAIAMSKNLLNYTSYIPLQKIAKGIITMQTRGIEQMEQIAKTTPKVYNSMIDAWNYRQKYLEITQNMIEKMKNSPRCYSINLSFINEMIPHHEGAIAMCENVLQYRIDLRLRKVAETILQEQSQGVEELRQIRKRLVAK